MAIHVFIVDDDPEMLLLVKRQLAAKKFKVTAALKSAEALALARKTAPDIALLDAEMPVIDGFELSRLFRKDRMLSKLPIIMISGNRVTEEDIIEGLDLGADDYLLKPVSAELLRARIQAVLRRYEACREKAARIKKLGMEINPQSRTLIIKEKLVVLTRKEFDLLLTLISQEGRLMSPQFLLETVWDCSPGGYSDTHTVEVHISSLRKKMGPQLSRHITTVTGHGYKFA